MRTSPQPSSTAAVAVAVCLLTLFTAACDDRPDDPLAPELQVTGGQRLFECDGALDIRSQLDLFARGDHRGIPQAAAQIED